MQTSSIGLHTRRKNLVFIFSHNKRIHTAVRRLAQVATQSKARQSSCLLSHQYFLASFQVTVRRGRDWIREGNGRGTAQMVWNLWLPLVLLLHYNLRKPTMNSAFVFIKPHANTAPTQALVKEKLAGEVWSATCVHTTIYERWTAGADLEGHCAAHEHARNQSVLVSAVYA